MTLEQFQQLAVTRLCAW